MPTFITYASYSTSGIKGMIGKPGDRGAAIADMVKSAGGKIIAMYMTSGDNDVVLISEFDDAEAVVALGMVVGASGSLSKLETVRAWSTAEFVGIAKKAGALASSYTPPGA